MYSEESFETLKQGQHSGASILIVDDMEVNLFLLREILEQAGYKVSEAANGSQALALVREQQPDLIMMDIVMPEMDGLQACCRLKADSLTRDVPTDHQGSGGHHSGEQ